MIRELMHDPIFLAQKAQDATEADADIAADLLETLIAHKESCVGMAANMIGEKKRIICFLSETGYMTMLNPEIVKSEEPYFTEEGCLSLLGGPKQTRRFKKVKVRYQTLDMKIRTKSFAGYTAQIIQHEIDHTNGVLI